MTCHRTRLFGALAVSLGTAAVAFVQGSAGDAKAAGAAQVTGTIVLQFNLTTALPAGTTIEVDPLVSPTDTVYSDGTSVTGSATVSGGKATLSLRIPYSWRVSSTADKVTIISNVYGYGSTSSTSLSNSTYFSSTIALPANGATTTVTYSGTL